MMTRPAAEHSDYLDDEILPIDVGETDLVEGELPDGDVEMPAWMELDEPIEDEPAVEVEE